MIVDGTYIDSMPASQARAKVRQMLLTAKAARVFITIENEERMLNHNPDLHAPEKKLPWPLCKMQMHDVELWFYKASDKVTAVQELRPSRRFKKEQIDTAIGQFLNGSKNDDEVRFNVDL
jgi:hypothetical protein